MIIINFSHPMHDKDIKRIEEITNIKVTEIRDIDTFIDIEKNLEEQLFSIIKEVGFTSHQWQTEPFLINPPSLNYSTAALISLIHGLAGHFPAIVRFKPISNVISTSFEVAEIINLQQLREKARQIR
ncbi:hypothetical protein SYNTR_1190 [Candidatus Syntrophocurvum alkaliphilum]|uniref:Uncharacterized protein n=1 Tax=Candidatus Syntrophocurvum alkaliphilum TaxID=2293317 RepID=A0A6I6DHM7_9FIRM|nr:CRISPR-associated protein Csx15 [Candidatus Syntrophocurvum alkaliphilum]QGT99783.1 hypothetical protein SYNTR_1190 [Candidatus Syntrophocurvum alkaliphilum]